MVIADDYDVIAPGVAVWRAYDPSVKCDLWSTALQRGETWIFIDPIELAPARLAEFLGRSRPSGVVVTNGNHARAAQSFRARYDVPIWGPQAAVEDLGFELDERFSEGDPLPGEMHAVGIPSAGPGEVALLSDGVLCFGDAVIHFGSSGFSLLPAKYCSNHRQLQNDLRKLLSYDIRVLTFAHGDPIVHDAKDRLQTLLA